MKKLTFVSILVLVMICSVFAVCSAAKVKPVSADTNGDKIFEDLANAMNETADVEEFDVIITFTEKFTASDLHKMIGDFTTKYEYQNIDAIAAKLSKAQIDNLSKHNKVKFIQADAEVKACLGTASSWFGVNKARTDFVIDGDRDGSATSYSTTDVVVAVIDTGIDAAHVDLDGGKVKFFKDFVNNRTTAYDDNGHGTHCAGIIAGTGEGNSAYKGVAPGASLIGLKVLDSGGSGSMSNIDAAIDWCITNKAAYNIKVISMSLGASGSYDGTDSTCQLVNLAYTNGIVPVIAAGNEGPDTYTVGTPGAAANGITVGAMADLGEKGFFLAYFSSRGLTADGRVKPDVCAPGYNIMAAKANSINQYVSMSGTSMATPFVAGTVALMLDINNALTPAQVKTYLTSTAQDWGRTGADLNYGYGRLQAYDAIKAAGSRTGTGPTVPAHFAKAEDLAGTGKIDTYTLTVNSTAYPIAITMIMDTTTPDFDVYLYNPSNSKVAYSEGTTRQETVTFTPTVTGTYTIKVSSYSGSGAYVMDVSAGAGALTLTSDQ